MRNSKKGFTIIEMVIVIAIIGILATVLIPTYGNVVASANESAAQQTARSTMVNWLARSTGAGGVPTTGDDGQGNVFYAAYFEYKNESNNQTYQYRYEGGTIVRTDGNAELYRNFAGALASGDEGYDNAPIQVIKGVYLTNTDSDLATKSDDYKVNLYRVKMTDKDDNSTYYHYYIEYPAKSVYDFGGCTVYAGTSGDLKYYEGTVTANTVGFGLTEKTLSNFGAATPANTNEGE